MKVTKKKDLLAKIKREEEERAARARVEAMLANDTIEALATDLYDTVKAAFRLTLGGLPYMEDLHGELYTQLEALRIRFANLGVEVGWEEVRENEG